MNNIFLKPILIALAAILFSSSAAAQTAQIQIIHNSADAAASTVDIYAGNALLVDDFKFRTATDFKTVPSDVNITIGIAPGNSTSSADTITTFNVKFDSGAKYIIVADGIVSSTGYTPIKAFDLKVYNMGQTAAGNSLNTDVLVHHGATDAPVVDVVAPFTATLVNDLAYGNFSSGYLQLPTADYRIQVRNSAGTDVVAEYSAPLQTLNLQGQALVVVASGFLNPTNNSNGASFGLFAALSSGGALVELPSATISSTRVQAIHNCADAAAASVDVYLNNTLIIDNFAFRTASPFIDAPAGSAFRLVICPPNSTDTTSKIIGFTYNLSASNKYVLIANGIVSGTGYTPAKAFEISVFGNARETVSNVSNTDVLVHHGSTDAPIVDVTANGAGTIVNNLAYAAFNPYLELPVADYILNVKDSSGSTTVVSYKAPLQTLALGGQAITVVASGFLNPTVNSNGPAFGLYVALSSGGNLIALPIENTSSISSVVKSNSFSISPNPVQNSFKINSVNGEIAGRAEIFSMNGQILQSVELGSNATVDVSNLASGIYSLRIISDRSITNTLLVK